MTLTPDQIVAANKANLNSLYGLSNQAFAGVEKLVELNLTAARASLNESADHAKALLSAKDLQEVLNLQAAAFQPLAEKAAAYNRHVYDIASNTNAVFGKAFESKANEAQHNVAGYFEAALKNAPAGSESAVAFLKQALNASNTAAESVQKVVKQATDLAESNFHAVTETAAKVGKTASKKR